MSDLTEFLLARIAEDEAAAREVMSPAPWSVAHDDFETLIDSEGEWAASTIVGTITHIARHDPARVLAQCAALRKVVSEHAPIEVYRERPLVCSTCVKVDDSGSYIISEPEDAFPCPTLRAVASIWADHSDYPLGD